MPHKSGGGQSAVVITGVDEVAMRLKLLPKAIQRKVVRGALLAGAEVLAQAVRDRAPVDTGELKAAVKTRAVKSSVPGVIVVETRIGEGDFKGGQFYAAFVEYGTSRMPPDPFMATAYAHAAPAARSVAMTMLLAGSIREVDAFGGP